MAFTSYAQNFEDVMLWRALKHIGNGRYVDVGAQHPVVDSVSKAFYENGWRGVHFEPVPYYADLLRNDRPDETVLQVAVSDRDGTLELNVIADTGLSTAVKAYADDHQTRRGFEYRTIQVPMLTLKTALSSLAGQPVHWLKIDVEGFEEQVLRGWDSAMLRPWIIVIEATVPLSTTTSFEAADRLLVDAHYQFAYFDGLNRFYVAAEHAELADALRVPPNVFDGVHLTATSGPWCSALNVRFEAERLSLETRLKGAEAQSQQLASEAAVALDRALAEARGRVEPFEAFAAQLAPRLAEAAVRAAEAVSRATMAEARASEAERRAGQAEVQAALLSSRLQAMSNTASWRLTAPLRAIRAGLRKFESSVRKSRIGITVRRRFKAAKAGRQGAAASMATAASTPPRPSSSASASASAFLPMAESGVSVSQISPRAQRIYQELKAAMQAGGN